MDKPNDLQTKLARIERVIEEQKAFCHRVPDPDTCERADEHLLELIAWRDALAERVGLANEIG